MNFLDTSDIFGNKGIFGIGDFFLDLGKLCDLKVFWDW